MINEKNTKNYAVIGRKIFKRIANKVILDGVDITIEKQSMYALLGENGTGKSVLLRCLMGVLKLDGGEVRILDDARGFVDSSDSSNISGGSVRNISGGSVRNISDGTVTHADRLSIGFAPQNFDIPGTMYVYQLLNFISAVNGLLKDQTIRRYKAMAIMIGLPESNHLISRLGYCQKKALSLVLAIIHQPELIVLDDITSGMDTTTVKNIWTLLSWINQTTECTIIVSASNNFCFMETVGILMNGKIVKEDTTKNLLNTYQTSSMGNLLIEVIFTEDDQRDPSVRTGRLPSIKNPITHHNYTALQLNSICITQNKVQGKRESLLQSCIVLQALIMKNICTLVGINSMFFAIWACAVLLPLAVHTAFMATSQRAVRITVYSQEASVTYNTSDDELGECDKYRTAETMSCTFARHYLAKSFELTYISIANDTTFRGTVIEWECLLIFNRNYTAALQRRIKKKIEQYADFENSQIIVTINMTDARKSEHVIDKLLERYNEFLYDYARDVPADINYKYIKYNYTSTHNHYAKYPIYRRYVNSGLTVVLTFFFHASIAVRLMQVAGDNCYYEAWKSHLSRLAVQIPLAVMWNAFSVEFMHNLYHIKSHHGYVFLCLLLESVCGIHLGYVLCLFIKTYFKVTVIIYIILTACVYDAGLWWPPSELFGWNYVIGSYLPITVGINFVRNLIEKNDFVERSLLILTCWTIVFVIVVIVNIIATKNGKKYNKLKNLL